MRARFVGLVVLSSALCLSCGGDPATSGVPPGSTAVPSLSVAASTTVPTLSVAASTTSGSSTVSPPAFRLAVEQRLADGAYIYTEGAWSFVEIRTAAGSAVAAADAPFDIRLDLLVTDIPAGSYVVASWQRPNQADGSPGSEIMDQCELEIEFVGAVQVLIVVNPGTGCVISTQVAGGA